MISDVISDLVPDLNPVPERKSGIENKNMELDAPEQKATDSDS